MADEVIAALKRQVADAIVEDIDGLSLQFAGGAIGADRWRAADLRAGRLERFSLDGLIRITARRRIGVTIHLSPRPGR